MFFLVKPIAEDPATLKKEAEAEEKLEKLIKEEKKEQEYQTAGKSQINVIMECLNNVLECGQGATPTFSRRTSC
jgi:hypothetical protein